MEKQVQRIHHRKQVQEVGGQGVSHGVQDEIGDVESENDSLENQLVATRTNKGI